MTGRQEEARIALENAIRVAQSVCKDVRDPAMAGSAIDCMLALFEDKMRELRRSVWVAAVERAAVDL